MIKHVLMIAATALVLALGPLGGTDEAFARGGGGGNWHGGGGGNWHGGGGGNWHGGGGNWHGGGWRGGGCWNCGWNGGWNGGWGWGWGVGPAFGLGLGYGAWGASRVCEPVFRAVKVRTSRGWRWRDVYVGDRCFWANNW
jgi:hypothetical protein